MPASTDVVDSWAVPGSGGTTYYDLHADGGLFAYGGAQPADLDYVAIANDGERYHFSPQATPGIFSYPGLPANERQGSRYFVRMAVLAYKGVSTAPPAPVAAVDLSPIWARFVTAGKVLAGEETAP